MNKSASLKLFIVVAALPNTEDIDNHEATFLMPGSVPVAASASFAPVEAEAKAEAEAEAEEEEEEEEEVLSRGGSSIDPTTQLFLCFLSRFFPRSPLNALRFDAACDF